MVVVMLERLKLGPRDHKKRSCYGGGQLTEVVNKEVVSCINIDAVRLGR